MKKAKFTFTSPTKRLLGIFYIFLLCTCFCYAQEKTSSSPELGIGYTRVSFYKVTPGIDFAYKLPVKSLYLRSGLALSSFRSGFDFTLNVGLEKRIALNQFSFILGGDIGFHNALRRGWGLSRFTLHSTGMLIGAGPVIGVQFMPLPKLGIAAELGFLGGYFKNPNRKHDSWNSSYIMWHRFPSVHIVYALK